MKKYIITDSHFNHTNIIKYENRPENFKELIVNNWIDIVPADAEVYHLGDVIFKQASELGEILAKTPGTKHLCLGNHDREKPTWFINKGFSTAQRYIVITYEGYKILLSHKPMDIAEIEKDHGHIDFNIHGHFHSKTREELDRTSEGYPFYSERHINLSIEEMEYKPIEIVEFLKLKGKL